MMAFDRAGRLFALLLVSLCSATPASATEKMILTVVVHGKTAEETIPVRNATISVVTTDGELERPSKANGSASFLVPAGEVTIIVTGQDTARHWATGICQVNIASELEVKLQLDLEEATRCKQESGNDDAAGDLTPPDDSATGSSAAAEESDQPDMQGEATVDSTEPTDGDGGQPQQDD